MALVVTTLIAASGSFDVVRDGQRVALRTARRVDDAVGFQGNQRVRVIGGGKADRLAVGEFAGVLADLLVRVHPHADQIQIGAPLNGADGDRSDAPVAQTTTRWAPSAILVLPRTG